MLNYYKVLCSYIVTISIVNITIQKNELNIYFSKAPWKCFHIHFNCASTSCKDGVEKEASGKSQSA